MGKYNLELKRNVLVKAKNEGYKQASKEYQVPESTIRRWSRAEKANKRSEMINLGMEDLCEAKHDMDAEVDCFDDPVDTDERQDVVSTAMAFLVIENIRLRETIRQLKNTINDMKGEGV